MMSSLDKCFKFDLFGFCSITFINGIRARAACVTFFLFCFGSTQSVSVFWICMLRETRPITVTVKSRKSLQLWWTNVPNQLVNFGYCLHAALLPDSLLLDEAFFFFVCIVWFVVFHQSDPMYESMKRKKADRERKSKKKKGN